MDSTHIELLEQFVRLLKGNPSLIHDDKLQFFKDYLIRFLLFSSFV